MVKKPEPGGIDPEFGVALEAFPPEKREITFESDGVQTTICWLPPEGDQPINQWWSSTALDDLLAFGPKLEEYGADDLKEIGHKLAAIAGRKIDDRQAAEWGCYFYLEGKLARWHSAITAGKDVSEDTLKDMSTYVNMARRIRARGELL